MNVETPRLLLRRPTRADVPALFAFLGDPDAMRYTHHDYVPALRCAPAGNGTERPTSVIPGERSEGRGSSSE